MTTNDLINLDYRLPETKVILTKALRLIPPIGKLENIEMSHVEKAIHIICHKYQYHLLLHQNPQVNKKYDIYDCCIINDNNLEQEGKVYGCCMEEVLIKTAIMLYTLVRRSKK